MNHFWIRLGLTGISSLAVWFAFLIGAIVVVTSLSRQDAISVFGGIAVFAVVLSIATALFGLIWLAWYRDHRRRAGR